MHFTARLPKNVPTSTNSFVVLVVLCLFIFGAMAFAQYMERRQREQRGMTERGAVLPQGRECDLVTMFASLPMPISGFGSTDCVRRRSHLPYWSSAVPRRTSYV